MPVSPPHRPTPSPHPIAPARRKSPAAPHLRSACPPLRRPPSSCRARASLLSCLPLLTVTYRASLLSLLTVTPRYLPLLTGLPSSPLRPCRYLLLLTGLPSSRYLPLLLVISRYLPGFPPLPCALVVTYRYLRYYPLLPVGRVSRRRLVVIVAHRRHRASATRWILHEPACAVCMRRQCSGVARGEVSSEATFARVGRRRTTLCPLRGVLEAMLFCSRLA